MKRAIAIFVTGLVLSGCSAAASGEPLTRSATIPLEGVSGRIDHMAVDLEGKRLIVAALGNGTVEVIDLAAARQAGRITGLHEPQGVLFVPEFNRIVVACGGDGTVRFYDGKSLQPVKTVDLGDDADNLRYDAAAGRIYVGYGRGAIGVLDARTGEKVGDIPLRGHPESFQLEARGSRIFVNVPHEREVVVIDRRQAAVVGTWPLKDARSNFPMALDGAHHRLFIGCRTPARLVVLDTQTGREVAALDCAGDADDVFYSAAAGNASPGKVYVSGGQGRVDVFEQTDADHYKLASETPTPAGARTSFLVPQLKSLYVAVPRLLLRGAELRVFRTD